jgi:hypothetical protein
VRNDRLISCFYDTRSNPVSFDFVNYVAFCDFLKTQNGHDVALEIICPVFRRTNSIEAGYPEDYLVRRVTNIFLPIAEMSRVFVRTSVRRDVDFDVPAACFPKDYHPARAPHGVVTGVSQLPLTYSVLERLFHEFSYDPKIFIAPKFELQVLEAVYPCADRLVTLTLRRTDHNAVRNCSLADFYTLYQWLVTNGFSVVVIPDQDDVFGNREYARFPWTVDLTAACDHRYRLALYHHAKNNFAWTSGVMATALLSNAPYTTFGIFNDKSSVSARDFFDRKGPKFESQLPWSAPKQYIDWTMASKVNASHLVSIANKVLA